MLALLEQAMREGRLRPLDFCFARFLVERSEAVGEVALAACMLSLRGGQGHVCIDLHDAACQDPFPDESGTASGLTAPQLAPWLDALRGSAAVGAPGDPMPMILHPSGRLYLNRYWRYETELAAAIAARTARPREPDEAWLRGALQRYFPPHGDGIDWQMAAAAMALLQSFAVVSGGPGTGKTSTVARILALLLEEAGERPLRIALAAPTGKAAARLTEAIRASKNDPARSLPAADAVLARMPESAQTLHRLLAIRPQRVLPGYHAGNPLPVDVLVLDEASMVDLPLMAKLVAALPDAARLIVLGDRDQLASVEAGQVLGDLCDTGAVHAYSEGFRARLQRLTGIAFEAAPHGVGRPIQDCVAVLRHSHRFAGAIGRLATAVNAGDADTALRLLREDEQGELAWCGSAATGGLAELVENAIEAYRPYLEAVRCGDPVQALAHFERYRLLCALRRGPTGSAALNELVELGLRRAGLVTVRERWYPGRPLMITRNDYALRLFNGDIGVVLPDPEGSGSLRVYFRGTDDAVKGVSPNRLPEHDTAYAMTVHKSQGSEFEQLDLLLGDALAPVLTRELVYTGITRARTSVRVWSAERAFRHALGTPVTRSSGLGTALWR